MKLLINGEYSLSYRQMVYNGGEVSVRLSQENFPFKDFESARITSNLVSSDDVMKLLMVTDALRRINRDIDIEVVLPYFPYARQDRVCNEGEALSVRVMADLINNQDYDSVTIWDAHSDVTPALLNNCLNVHCHTFLSHVPGIRSMTLVAPDTGAGKKIHRCAEELHTRYVTASKVRDPATGDITDTKLDAEYILGDICVVDDICDGGRTFVELGRILRSKITPGGKLFLYVTHGIFSNGTGELRKYFDRIYCPNPWDEKLDTTFMEKICTT